MTPGEWVGLGTSVVLALISIWKHLKAKDYGGALAATVEGIEQYAKEAEKRGAPQAGQAVKVAVRARAVASGIEPVLHAIVKARTSSGKTGAAAPLAGILLLAGALGAGAAGCATPEAGRSQAPAWGQGIQVPIVQVYIGQDAGLPATVDEKGRPVSPISILVTNSGAGTTAPASTANQTATTDVKPNLQIPAGAVGGLGSAIRLPSPAPPSPPPAEEPPPAPAEPPR